MADFKIKIGRVELIVHPGEYFLDNGVSLQFITKDDSRKRLIKSGLASWYTTLKVPKKRKHMVKENPNFTKFPSKKFPGCFIWVYLPGSKK